MFRRSFRVLALGGLLLTPQLSSADAPPTPVAVDAAGCDAWFPDIACGRSGRPEGFFKPIVQPYLFEDPFVTTGASLYYVHHDFPNRSALGGGDAHVVALQLRVALTERFALIATKDGYVWNRPGNPLLADTQGWLNLGLGVKGILYESVADDGTPFIVSGILRYETDSGGTDTFQGHGDGMIMPSLAAATALGPVNLIGDLGAQVPIDSEQSTSMFAHLYASLDLTPRFQPFAQLSWVGWVDDGDGSLPVPLRGGVELPLSVVQSALGTGAFEGADVFNLGSTGVGGLDLWTVAVGGHVALTEHLALSVAYERPFSHHKGIFGQRVVTNLTLEF